MVASSLVTVPMKRSIVTCKAIAHNQARRESAYNCIAASLSGHMQAHSMHMPR